MKFMAHVRDKETEAQKSLTWLKLYVLLVYGRGGIRTNSGSLASVSPLFLTTLHCLYKLKCFSPRAPVGQTAVRLRLSK